MSNAPPPLLAGVELGGTKSIVTIGRGRTMLDRQQVKTEEPAPTLARLVDLLRQLQARHGKAAALGIASFGPVRLQPHAPDFGHLLKTPKQGWSGVDVYGALSQGVDGPAAIDTDVNGAALAEGEWGASRGCGVHLYVTIGTGIGGGLVVAGKPVHGILHPELGHIRVRRDAGDIFPGICPFHGDCLEGLASGPAIAARAGVPADQLLFDHPIWTTIARELGDAMAMLILTVAAERIVIGGGVGQGCDFLLPAIRQNTAAALGGYGATPDVKAVSQVIVGPDLGADVGPLGSLRIADLALRREA